MIKKIVFETDYFGQVTGKKNSKVIAINRHTGRPFVRMNDKAKAQEKEMVENFVYDMKFYKLSPEDFDGKRIEVAVEFWNQDKRKHDLDNQLSTVLDALVKAQILPDDSQETVFKVTAEYKGVDREDPRALITITAI